MILCIVLWFYAFHILAADKEYQAVRNARLLGKLYIVTRIFIAILVRQVDHLKNFVRICTVLFWGIMLALGYHAIDIGQNVGWACVMIGSVIFVDFIILPKKTMEEMQEYMKNSMKD